MGKVKTKSVGSSNSSKKIRPALTPEARENQMISLAMDLVQERLINGTASSQETTHFLKLGSLNARLEREKLMQENELLRARTEALQSDKKVEELYAEAIQYMKKYAGQEDVNDEY